MPMHTERANVRVHRSWRISEFIILCNNARIFIVLSQYHTARTYFSYLFDLTTAFDYHNCTVCSKSGVSLMKYNISGSLLVLLILPFAATIYAHEPTVLMGCIQFPHTLKTQLSPIPITYKGDKVQTSVDSSNKNITYSIVRENRQFAFKLLITEPENIDPVFLSSKYEPHTGVVKYQRLKEGASYRFFRIILEPSISKERGTHITYSWRISEDRLSGECKIPDDALIMHSAPEWVAKLDGSKGFEFPTVCMHDNLIQIEGSEEHVKDRMNRIALAATFIAPFTGKPQEVAMKRKGTTIVYAAPAHHTA